MRILVLLNLIVSIPLLSQGEIRVVLDPGHGGTDRGVVRGKAIESQIALEISQKLEKRLKEQPEVLAFMTRSNDKELSLLERVEYARKMRGDFFISIHANSSPDPKTQGAEFYFRDPMLNLGYEVTPELTNPLSTREPQSTRSRDPIVDTILMDLKSQYRAYRSRELTLSLNQEWTNEDTHKRYQSIRQGPFYVINKSNVPAVLIEVGFVSNPSEARRLLRPETQNEIAEQIYRGILKFKEIIDRDRAALIQ